MTSHSNRNIDEVPIVQTKRIAVLIPCFNEEKTIGDVIDDFKNELPEAKIYIGDNNSSDKTVSIAESMGVTVIKENRQGKGHMLKTLVENIEAEIFIMVDGDGTYAARDIHQLILPVIEGKCDMCIGNRLSNYQPGSFSHFHLIGNKLIRYLTYRLHGVEIPDMLTGYRVMSRKLIDELCLISGGFEIETEINIKSVWLGSRICSVDIHYSARPAGSISKIKTINDGYRILSTIFMLLREYQPMTMGGIFCLISSTIGTVVFCGGLFGHNLFYFILGLSMFLIGTIALATGIILNAINISHRELEQFHRKLFKS